MMTMREARWRGVGVAWAVALCLGLAGCGNEDSDDDVRGAETGGRVGTGGEDGSGGGGDGSGGGPGTSGGTEDPAEAFPDDTRVIYLHHSTGGVIWEGGVAAAVAAHNDEAGTAYAIEERAYPNDPYPWENYPYDYYNIWVANAGDTPYEGQDTLEILTHDYDVIVFKHCFPVSGIGADTGAPDVASSAKTLENYRAQYAALKDKLHEFPEHRFLVWTGAALTASSSDAEQGARAREFFTWVKEEWDEPGDNVFVWDFFELETEGGDFLLDAYSADGGGDSHPSADFAAAVAPLFATRLVDVIEGRGDTGSLTGG